jgi:hypothetical protein
MRVAALVGDYRPKRRSGARDSSGNPANFAYGKVKELQRIARFFAKQKMRPNFSKILYYGSWRVLSAAHANRYSRPLRHGVTFALGMPARSAYKPAGGRGAHVNPLAGGGLKFRENFVKF